MSRKIRLAVVGLGNCASSLIQGIEYYKDAGDDEQIPGLMHANFGGYHVKDIDIVAVFDVNSNKVGKDISEAVKPETYIESKKVAKQGGNVAKVAMQELEARTGKKVVTALNAKQTLLAKKKSEDNNE